MFIRTLRSAPVALIATALVALAGCSSTDPGADTAPTPEVAEDANPAAPGFDVSGSDPRAIEIADATMRAMGGRAAWEAVRYLSWNFFGVRDHVWDKHRGIDRVEWNDLDTGTPHVVIVDVNTGEGRAWVDGLEIVDATARADLTARAKEAWINDAYWLVMPYKLKDSGVTLTYAGKGTLGDGRGAEVLELTFEAVGVTPRNKYLVYVADDTGLVEQWDFFADRADEDPRFTTPWADWREFGAIRLSGDRGQRKLTHIATHDDLPAAVFEDPSPTGLRAGTP